MDNIKQKKERLDVFLVNNGLFETREKARIAIMEGKVFVNNQKEDKPGTMIKHDSHVEFRGEKLRYVSRGGLKLEKAIDVFKIDLKDRICVDIGSSTGGFTDCMLQNGAKKVFAVDCGTNQLDYKLRSDSRVITMENTNARYIKLSDLRENDKDLSFDDKIDFISVDVSFISLTKIIPTIKELRANEAVILIKPQFEAGKDLVEKNGIITNKKVHEDVIKKIISFSKDEDFVISGLDYSPIKGPAGNIEYLLYITRDENKNINLDDIMINELVKESHEKL